MSIFKTKPPSHPDAWKEKYYALLDEQDQLDKSYQETQDLLCKTIVRFAIAIKGLNRQLDPHLSRIRDVLKTGVKHKALHDSLQAFSDALIALEEGAQQPDVSLLFDFLEQNFPSLRQAFNRLQQQYEQGTIASLPALYNELLRLTTPVSATVAKDEPPASAVAEDTLIHLQRIKKQLCALLDSLELPEHFVEQVQQLKNSLLDQSSIDAAIEAVTSLLIAVKKQQDMEQRQMTEFLAKLTDQLAEMGLATASLNSANVAEQQRRDVLDTELTSQLDDLQKKSALATQLAPLQALINTRLQSVNERIQIYSQQSQVDRDKYQQQLRLLTQKVNDLEAESAELKTRLDTAQFHATRDPLTGLPNRMAYDERLRHEMAHARRNRTPLSLAVWDIDFFKQINDQYGHKSGDKALIIIARLLSKQGRNTDFVARFGGEEFVMLLPETDLHSAIIVVEKLRSSIGNSSFNANGDKISITLSCGLSEWLPTDNAETLFNRADQALYQAKQNGRNQYAVG